MNNIKIISKQEFLKTRKKIPSAEEVWDEISDLWNEYRKEPFETVKEFLKNKKGKIIDLGCGSGRNMIKNDNLEYYEVDVSSCQLGCAMHFADESGINAKFFKLSADKLSKKDFKNEMFDYGLFIAALHCIEGEKNRENALKELFRVLKKGAQALISVWNSSDSRFDYVGNHGEILMSWKKDGKEHYRYYYLYERKELIDLLKKTGFDIIEISEDGKDRFSKKNLVVRVKKL
jgi:tRNA (uracil-5-)-methyltransferase TRM9